ncbi:hypothetical protein ABZ863_30060 [Saccharomonospora sp. NPDC046836]|uniref:hypothetical protein n=1 Tax=Saccharomonospora sp. NPDC046836 TaxID=3156921 RepID=UPI0033D3AC53
MSIPSIPGYTQPPSRNTLADLWSKPAGDFPTELWPDADLRSISRDPSGWIVVEEHYFEEARHGGRGCVLVRPKDEEEALRSTSWIGHDLGKVWVKDGGGVDNNGLVATERRVEVEFFVSCSEPVGAAEPVIHVSHPYLWYWDAFPVKNGWNYLNRAGREQELIRYEITQKEWRVEIKALEFRQYLAESGRSAIMQIDHSSMMDSDEFDRVDDEFREDWAHFDIHVVHQYSIGNTPAFSRLMGQWLLTGMLNSRVPRMHERREDRDYPEFIYGLSATGGQPLTHTCDPDQLGTYFDKDGSRLHYLTPVYFRREVLQPYALEPNKYRISAHRLECLNLWGVDISFNSVGLVEVYLGDIGRDLPSDEWGHWRSYNVTPEGKMEEGRFRRDFLNQPAASRDPAGDLRRARASVSAASEKLLGKPIWKPLSGDIKAEFQSLIGPLAEDATSFNYPFLALTKVLVDGIDPAPLKQYLSSAEKGDLSLQLLRKFADELGDDSDVTAILRSLQGFRSKGGVAHLPSSRKADVARELGIDGLSALEAFDNVLNRASNCLNRITGLISARLDSQEQRSDTGTNAETEGERP